MGPVEPGLGGPPQTDIFVDNRAMIMENGADIDGPIRLFSVDEVMCIQRKDVSLVVHDARDPLARDN
eukprot:841271-Prorocentrum_lima.AAC.1